MMEVRHLANHLLVLSRELQNRTGAKTRYAFKGFMDEDAHAGSAVTLSRVSSDNGGAVEVALEMELLPMTADDNRPGQNVPAASPMRTGQSALM